MKIMFLGDVAAGQTSFMRMRALQRLGHEVVGVNTSEPWKSAPWLMRQVQRRLQAGSIITGLNASVLKLAAEFRPDLIWAEKQEYLTRDTLENLRAAGCRLVHFTPDPYFSLEWKRTKLMDEALLAFDALVYCKRYETENYESLRLPLFYMPLGFCDEVHRPIKDPEAKWRSAVGFLGGWEPRREALLDSVAQTGTELKIWGGYWDFLADGRWTLRRALIMRQLAGDEKFTIQQNSRLAACLQGGEVYSDEYACALSGAEIGLGFLRKVCPDQHTTRSFEIPACGSMLMADRTVEHQEFFEEDREAIFFSSKDELTEKVQFYTRHRSARRMIAQAGHERCVTGRYAYIHRMRAALDFVSR